jgi:MerR family transcriptional regulator, mercuric resistance operon regulatory protein
VRTSELAAQAAVGVETLRYYERRGLLDAPKRTASGYRSWSPGAVRVVRFVKRAQEVGFTLADVEELLHLAEGGPDSCDTVRAMAQRRLADLAGRIADLVAMRDALARLVATCDRPPGQRDCPLLHALDPAAEQDGEPS